MEFEASIGITAAPERVFAIYADVGAWKEWDREVKDSSLNGDFVAGTEGRLVPVKGPAARIRLSRVEPGRSFTVESRLPLCWMHFEHEIWEDGAGVSVTHRVRFSGPGRFLFGRLVGRVIARGLPDTLRGLKARAEA